MYTQPGGLYGEARLSLLGSIEYMGTSKLSVSLKSQRKYLVADKKMVPTPGQERA